MKNWLLVAAALLTTGAMLVGWQRPSDGRRGETWEYCQVRNWVGNWKNEPVPAGAKFRYTFVGKAVICYDEASGCRTEAVTASFSALDRKDLYSDLPYLGEAQQAAVAKALSKLGAEGWRLVGAGPDPSAVQPDPEKPFTPVASILYFERPKP